jgi:hypothetical protein
MLRKIVVLTPYVQVKKIIKSFEKAPINVLNKWLEKLYLLIFIGTLIYKFRFLELNNNYFCGS